MSLTKVTLGDHEVDVVPQRHAYLTNRLSKYVDRLAERNLDIEDAKGLATFLGSEAYDLLSILIPQYGKRCPHFEFLGYGSQAACDAGEYDDEQDKSPTFDEIINAFSVSAEVQRFDTLKVLGKVVDPKVVKAWVNSQIADQLTKPASLPSAPGGAETLTSSTATSQTPTESQDSPSPGPKVSCVSGDDES